MKSIFLQALILRPREGEAAESRGQGPVPAYAPGGPLRQARRQVHLPWRYEAGPGQVKLITFLDAIASVELHMSQID